MPSHRENIMVHLLSALGGATGAKFVSRDPIELVELHHTHQLPAALLQEGEQVIDPHFEQDSTFVPQALTLYVLTVTVLVVVVKAGGVNTILNAWMADLLTASMIDRTRGGAAMDTHFLGVSPPREDRVVPDNLAAAEMRFAVRYVAPANTL